MSIRRIAPAACVVFFATTDTAFSSESAPSGYSYYSIGDVKAPTPGKTETGLMLMGGGGWVKEAFHWLAKKGGGGHFVILRASGADDLHREPYSDIGGVTSVETPVFSSRKAASDPRVLSIIRHANGIFLAGGDQANYVRYWQGTPLNKLLDAHVRAGKPIGGSSAGQDPASRSRHGSRRHCGNPIDRNESRPMFLRIEREVCRAGVTATQQADADCSELSQRLRGCGDRVAHCAVLQWSANAWTQCPDRAKYDHIG